MANIEQNNPTAFIPNAVAQTSPIGQLSVELVLVIIQALIDEICQFDSALQTVHSLSLIDKRFNDLINETRTLWTRLSVIDPPRLLSKAMQISKSRPLEIHCESHNLKSSISYERATEAFLRIVAPASLRWRSIHLFIPDNAFDRIVNFLNLSTPMLQVMVLSGDYSDMRPSIRPFRWSMDRIEELHVKGLRIDWSSHTFAGLISVELSDRWSWGWTSIRQILQLLAASPNLASLKLWSLHPSPLANSAPFNPIQLPKLITLTLSYTTSACELLCSIRMPALKRLQIEASLKNRSITSLFNNHTSHLQPALLSSLSRNSQPARLVLGDGEAFFSSEAFELTLLDLMPHDIFLSTPAAAEPLLSSIPFVLEFDQSFDLLHGRFLQTLVAAPRIQEIVLNRAEGVAELLELLTKPAGDGFPCPELTVLRLNVDASHMANTIQAMVESRYAERGQEKRPEPFRMVYLNAYGWTPWMVSRLADVVGADHIWWDSGDFAMIEEEEPASPLW